MSSDKVELRFTHIDDHVQILVNTKVVDEWRHDQGPLRPTGDSRSPWKVDITDHLNTQPNATSTIHLKAENGQGPGFLTGGLYQGEREIFGFDETVGHGQTTPKLYFDEYFNVHFGEDGTLQRPSYKQLVFEFYLIDDEVQVELGEESHESGRKLVVFEHDLFLPAMGAEVRKIPFRIPDDLDETLRLRVQHAKVVPLRITSLNQEATGSLFAAIYGIDTSGDRRLLHQWRMMGARQGTDTIVSQDELWLHAREDDCWEFVGKPQGA